MFLDLELDNIYGYFTIRGEVTRKSHTMRFIPIKDGGDIPSLYLLRTGAPLCDVVAPREKVRSDFGSGDQPED